MSHHRKLSMSSTTSSDDEMTNELTTRPAQKSFGSAVSSILEFKYDELNHSNQWLIRKLHKKDTKIKFLKEKMAELMDKQNNLEMKNQNLHRKYLKLQNEKNEEIFYLKQSLEFCREMIDFLKTEFEKRSIYFSQECVEDEKPKPKS